MLEVSRQLQWRRKKKAAGLCLSCGARPRKVKMLIHCEVCCKRMRAMAAKKKVDNGKRTSL
jgi:hypothetical protein